MYQQCYDTLLKAVAPCIRRLKDGAVIPFDPANTDYAEFKKAVTAGAELQDADGVVMTPEAAQEFVKGLI